MSLTFYNKKILITLIFCFVVGGFFVLSQGAEAWTEPTGEPPGGNIAAPINVSATTQTKKGSLIIGTDTEGVLKLEPKTMNLGEPCIEGEMYYRQGQGMYYCDQNTSWEQVGAGASGNFVILSPDITTAPQKGFIEIEGRSVADGVVDPDWFAIKGTASESTAGRPSTTGIEGQSYSSLAPTGRKSYGVFGYANVNEATSFAVYGSAEHLSAYAGYFKGNVAIESSGAGPTSLTLKPNVSLCFEEGQCIDASTDFTGGGGSSAYWSLNGFDIHPNNNAYSLAVGGTGSDDTNTVMYVNTAGEGSVVIGQPINLTVPPPVSWSCGDGACNNSESGDSTSANYCDTDCATIFLTEPFFLEASELFVWTAQEEHFGEAVWGETNQYGEGTLPLNQAQPSLGYTADMPGLTDGQTYYFKVVIWDEESQSQPKDTRVFTGSFEKGATCDNDGTCETPAETCANCPSDCAGIEGTIVGCSEGSWCCSDGTCNQCCIDSNCASGYCCDNFCKECCNDGNCASGHCCDGLCKDCCSSFDCGPGNECCNGTCEYNCCPGTWYKGCSGETPYCSDDNDCVECFSDDNCVFLHGTYYKCCPDRKCYHVDEECPKSGSGKDKPVDPEGFKLPLAYLTKEEDSQVINENKDKPRVLGAVSYLSQSLLIPEARAQTEIFKNIIPVAEAATPFDALDNRKLTIYGGVATIINGDANATHAMELGKYHWINSYANGMGIISSGSLFLTAKDTSSGKEYNLWIDKNTGRTMLPGEIYTGYKSGEPGDIHIFRNGSCNSGSCRAMTNLAYDYRYCENDSTKAQCTHDYAASCPGGETCCLPATPNCNQYVQTVRLNYNKDFEGGVETPGKFYIGFAPSYAELINNNTLIVKNNSLDSAIYAEQSNASGYAGYFSGKVYTPELCLLGDCRNAWPESALSGSGTANYLTKWTGGSALGNSVVYETGGKIGIGQNAPLAKLTVNNNISDTGSSTDAIFAAVNNGTAISARQTGTGYAGYFSGKVNVSGVLAANKIGIGTNDPSGDLDIATTSPEINITGDNTIGNASINIIAHDYVSFLMGTHHSGDLFGPVAYFTLNSGYVDGVPTGEMPQAWFNLDNVETLKIEDYITLDLWNDQLNITGKLHVDGNITSEHPGYDLVMDAVLVRPHSGAFTTCSQLCGAQGRKCILGVDEAVGGNIVNCTLKSTALDLCLCYGSL